VTRHLQRLWAGEVTLADAFWRDALLYGSMLNLLATGLAFAVLASDGPALAATAIFFAPVPYNMLAVVGVWRSAARPDSPPQLANVARIAVVAWAIAATLL
jgi:hypothetical protein